MTSALVCDERRAIRERILGIISAVPSIDTVETVTSGDELLSRYGREPVDIVLIGTQRALETGVETTRRLLASEPEAVAVVFGAADDRQAITSAIAAGAHGYLRWDATGVEVTAMMAHRATGARVQTGPATVAPDTPLSAREIQVLSAMSLGHSNGEIGQQLFLSEDTIKTHARRLFRKLGARDRAQAVAIGFRQGLLS